jgi:periplasmic divalent cation tolerance protein
MDERARVVLMTAPDRETAEELAEALVGERLAACANVLPGITSIYWWEGAVEKASEVLVVLKTAPDRVEALVERAAEIHPYDVPEVIALPVREGHGPYLTWVERETTSLSTEDGTRSPG